MIEDDPLSFDHFSWISAVVLAAAADDDGADDDDGYRSINVLMWIPPF